MELAGEVESVGIGTIGRDNGQVPLRVAQHTDGKTLTRHVAQFTRPSTVANTDEWQARNQIECQWRTVNHVEREWAHDDEGDGTREVHINTTEGLWTGARNSLQPCRGVHADHLHGYVAMCAQSVNLKRITPRFIAALVRCTQFRDEPPQVICFVPGGGNERCARCRLRSSTA